MGQELTHALHKQKDRPYGGLSEITQRVLHRLIHVST
jgi:hypothetical protein